MKSLTLIMAIAASTLTACAQVDCRNYDNLYVGIEDSRSVTQFDEVVENTSSVKNVLVKNKEVINYYHDNEVVEYHYNISGRPLGYARHVPRAQIRHQSRKIVVPRRSASYYTPVECYEQPQYTCLGNDFNNKWFFFFQFNSDFLTNKEELGHLIDYAKTNPYSYFYVDAYADAETGGYDVNMRISQMRANAVISVLLREGISRSRIFVQHHGSISQPYRTNNLNRCVTVSTTSRQ